MRGVTFTDRSPGARLGSIAPGAVVMHPGFWSERMAANRRGITALHDRLEAEGIVDNFRRLAGTRSVERRGLWFTDSDLYKWMEAAAWSLTTAPDPDLSARLDDAIGAVTAAQAPDGYLNTAFAGERYQELHRSHELYCAGHLIQAAIAHHRVTGDGRLLECATRLADHLASEFGPGRREQADGHPGIEMALVELYRETGDARSLELASYLLDRVDHASLRELWGHAVRMQYYACGLLDAFVETGGATFAADAERLWASLVDTRVYVTGGLGGRWLGESVGRAYELPNESAYAETCAAIANVMWAWRRLQLGGDVADADRIELALHNAMLVGMSLDGDEWSYVNPLADAGHDEQDPWPYDLGGFNLCFLPARRRPFHPCTCCPPNVNRMLASLPGYLYGTGEPAELWVHQYAASTVRAAGLTLTQHTTYPWDGRVDLVVDDVEPSATDTALVLRVPGWCEEPSLTVREGVPSTPPSGSYARVAGPWRPGDRVVLDLPMLPQLLECHPRVSENRGNVAIRRGPLVYCIESVDHPGIDVLEAELSVDAPLYAEHHPDLLGGVTLVRAAGRAPVDTYPGLYERLGHDASRPRQETELTAIPYFAWANRELGSMTVWLRRA